MGKSISVHVINKISVPIIVKEVTRR